MFNLKISSGVKFLGLLIAGLVYRIFPVIALASFALIAFK